ncbi:MAG: D-sedoheptulose 7-phosphate isomerase [Alphaproteobacteria bacterium]|nr:D-sedoheptulose 7-phosphate isomerase [Alphaproteobacteria bacterium]
MSDFNLNTYWQEQTKEHNEVTEKTIATLQEEFDAALEACAQSIKNGNKLMFFGNGGSAADAQHLATELSVRYIKDRPPIPGIALTTDTSTLTATGNDYGFDYIFSRQIESIGKKGDIAIAISTSGNSPNIINAITVAKTKGITVIGLSGKTGGKMHNICDHLLIVPSNTTARIQEMHILLGHMLCGALEKKLKLVS